MAPTRSAPPQPVVGKQAASCPPEGGPGSAPPQPVVGKQAASCPPQPVVGKQAASCPPGGGQVLAAGVEEVGVADVGIDETGVEARGRRPDGARGFTLLEVLVAVAILSLSLTSLLGSQMQAMRATDRARQLSAIAFLAEAQLIYRTDHPLGSCTPNLPRLDGKGFPVLAQDTGTGSGHQDLLTGSDIGCATHDG